MLRLAVALLVLLVGLPALAQQVPSDVEAALRKWGIPTSTEVRSLENRIWVTGADALDDLVKSGRCRVTLPMLEELEGKALLLAELVDRGVAPTLENENWRDANERGRVIGAARVATFIRMSAGWAILDQGRCKISSGDAVAGTMDLLRGLDLARKLKGPDVPELALRLRTELYPLLALDPNAP